MRYLVIMFKASKDVPEMLARDVELMEAIRIGQEAVRHGELVEISPMTTSGV